MAAAAERRLTSVNCTPRGNGSYCHTDINAYWPSAHYSRRTGSLYTRAHAHAEEKKKGSEETVKHNHWYSYDHKRYIFKLTVVATSYAPFLWQMCFSGRPFLYGIQIFFRGFCVSSRGFVAALSSIPSCGEVEVAAAAAGTRGFFPWCCSEVDRCFIRVGVAGWRRHERSFLSFSVPLVTWPDLPIPTTGSWT